MIVVQVAYFVVHNYDLAFPDRYTCIWFVYMCVGPVRNTNRAMAECN